MTERPIADVPIEGIELPAGSFVLAARSSGAAARRHRPRRSGRRRAPCRVAVGGTGRRRLVGAHRAGEPASCCPTVRSAPRSPSASRRSVASWCSGRSPIRSTIRRRSRSGSTSWCGWGSDRIRWLPELAGAVERLGPVPTWEADVALAAAARTFAAAGEAARRCATSSASSSERRHVARACCASGGRVLHPVARIAVRARWGTVPVRASCRVARAVDRDPRRADRRVVGVGVRRRCRWRCAGTEPDRRCCGSRWARRSSCRRRSWRRDGPPTRRPVRRCGHSRSRSRSRRGVSAGCRP